jgi:hypothetical protein
MCARRRKKEEKEERKGEEKMGSKAEINIKMRFNNTI